MFRPTRLALAAVLPVAACGTATTNPTPTEIARLRIVNLVTGQGPIDVQVDAADRRPTNLAYATVAPSTRGDYYLITVGTRRLRVFAPGGTTALFDTTFTAENLQAWTFAWTGVAGATDARRPGFIPLADTLAALPGELVRLRVVHAASAVGALDVFMAPITQPLPATPTIENITFRQGGVAGMPSGNTRVCVTSRGTPPGANNVNCLVNRTTELLSTGSYQSFFLRDPDPGQSGVGVLVTTER
ncbi:MAG: DUF4397 domain-containing protein [Gemmatimonadales bacterium]|nr:DUF4397 domain-containing protein [Gemmatimonadales bacterium]